ncbi:MAG: hypothetical protein LM589_01390 [Thermosphaera sp.]|nr:hypothetical protein [Thermosphaera sp.]
MHLFHLGLVLKPIHVRYMRIKEVRGLMKVQLIPTSREKAMALLRG